jgi:outer membrane protein assembly factor BamB
LGTLSEPDEPANAPTANAPTGNPPTGNPQPTTDSTDAPDEDPSAPAPETDESGTERSGNTDPGEEPEATQDVSLKPSREGQETADSDSWTSFRNGLRLRGIAGSQLPTEPELLWEIPTVHGTRSTAAIRNGCVYIGTLDGYVLCLNLRTGEEIWNYRTIESTDPEEFAPGFNAPTTVSDNAVFLGDEDGVLHALDRETGDQLWTYETRGEIVGGACLLPGDRVMFGSHDGGLYCLAADSGELIWQFDAQGPINGTQAVSGDVSDEGRYTFVTGCDKPTLRVVDTANGEQVAEVPLGDALLIASPALVGEVLYFGTDAGEVVALDWQQQSNKWIYSDPDEPNQINSSPAVTDEVVIIGSRDRRMHCMERGSGARRWVFETRGMIDGSPVVVGNRVFFGSMDRNLYAVNIEDGSESWQYQVGQRINGSPAVGEGCLVIGADQRGGKILCFGTP